MRFLDLEISTDPARWDPHSFEVRINNSFFVLCCTLRPHLCRQPRKHACDITSMWGAHQPPQFGPPTSASAFSVSSGVKPTSSDVVNSVPGLQSSYLGLGCPVPGLTFDGESATTICSLCAARLDVDSRGCDDYEELGRDTRNCFPRRPIIAF